MMLHRAQPWLLLGIDSRSGTQPHVNVSVSESARLVSGIYAAAPPSLSLHLCGYCNKLIHQRSLSTYVIVPNVKMITAGLVVGSLHYGRSLSKQQPLLLKKMQGAAEREKNRKITTRRHLTCNVRPSHRSTQKCVLGYS